LKVVDHWLIARYCETQSEWENLNKFRQQNEIFKEMTSSKGVKYFAKHPQISRLETIEQLLLRLEKQLGIGSSGSGDGPGGTDKVQDAIKKILARSS
jgi:phage terminase small subunit